MGTAVAQATPTRLGLLLAWFGNSWAYCKPFVLRLIPAWSIQTWEMLQQAVMCPLCSLHPDSQAASFQCSELRKLVDVRGDYMNIFSENFSSELVKTVFNIYYFRAEFIKLHG